jgi:hypothetical protein
MKSARSSRAKLSLIKAVDKIGLPSPIVPDPPGPAIHSHKNSEILLLFFFLPFLFSSLLSLQFNVGTMRVTLRAACTE